MSFPSFLQFLKEDPDSVAIQTLKKRGLDPRNTTLSYKKEGARCFTIIDNVIVLALTSEAPDNNHTAIRGFIGRIVSNSIGTRFIKDGWIYHSGTDFTYKIYGTEPSEAVVDYAQSGNTPTKRSIKGRFWIKHDVVSFWCSFNYFKRAYDSSQAMEDIAARLQVNLDKYLWEFVTIDDTIESYTTDEVLNSNVSVLGAAEPARQEPAENIHLMSPERKSRALKHLGVKPKSPGSPKWLRDEQ